MKSTFVYIGGFTGSLVIAILTLGQDIEAQSTVQITTPAAGAVISPNQTVTVDVSTSGGPFTSVGIVAPGYMNGSLTLQSPPFEFSFTVPPR
jgi:hypothetical protein